MPVQKVVERLLFPVNFQSSLVKQHLESHWRSDTTKIRDNVPLHEASIDVEASMVRAGEKRRLAASHWNQTNQNYFSIFGMRANRKIMNDGRHTRCPAPPSSRRFQREVPIC
jgi:hypothetical protein